MRERNLQVSGPGLRGDAQQLRSHRPDYWIIILAALLISVGLIVVYSISPALGATHGGSGGRYVGRQIIAILLAIVAFIVCARIPLSQWRKWQWPILGVAAVGTLIALLTPVNPAYPAHRWIRFGGFSLQSVEVLKFALLLALSGFLASAQANGYIDKFHKTLKPLLYALLAIGVVVAGVQSDLGSTGVVVVMMAGMAFIAGMPMKKILLVGVAVVILATLAISSTPYRRERLATYLQPEKNCLTTSYQACQALIAVGSGGVTGLGVGKGVQAYGYLPEAQNDSIFAIYAEKFGFLGTVTLLSLYMLLFARLKAIIERAPDVFSRLLVAGVLAWLSTQTLINIGAMIGLLPLKGITLPLVSYGGTSVLFVGAALGLVYQVSHYTNLSSRFVAKNRTDRTRNAYENSHDRRRVRGAYHPSPSGR